MSKSKVFIPDYLAREYRKLLKLLRSTKGDVDFSKIRIAFTLANDACNCNNSYYSEPLIMQALQVAQIVANDLPLGTEQVCIALMFKFVENGLLDEKTIEASLGKHYATQTKSLAEISKINTQKISGQAENFRKLLLTITDDVRIVLVKLADRLYVMRNLETEETEVQKRIAKEVFDLYAPIAHRLGLYNVKTELEELAMKFANPDMYNYIEKKLQDTASARNKFIKEFIVPVKAVLDQNNFVYEIKSRTKSIFSIYNKMRKQNIEFEEVYDLFAIRIILKSSLENEKSDCWKVFSLITSMHPHNPERMRDWLTVPKSSGYESLHATVMTEQEKWVEVQIRTQRMDEIAEKGFAAHWKYKGQKADGSIDIWINKIREVLESSASDSASVIDNNKLSLYSQEIFVFTPKGDLRTLPKGATVLDFAYEIHTNVGSTCTGAKINGKNVPIRYELKNGDKVEIITSKTQTPKNDWIDFAVTTKARSKIKLALKNELILRAEAGKEIFRRRLRNWKIGFNDVLVSKLMKHFKIKTAIDFYSLIADEKIEMAEIKKIITATEKTTNESPEKIDNTQLEKIIPSLAVKSEEVLEIDNKIINHVEYKLAKCCSPIFGDDIFGFITINDGIKIHRVTCPNARDLVSRFGYRIVKARWSNTDNNTFFQAALRVTGNNELGILSKITDIIAKDLKVNLRSINVDTQDVVFEGVIKLFVKEVSHLDMLIHKLMKVSGVDVVHRIEA